MNPIDEPQNTSAQTATADPELLADMLKERIYASLALLAVLLTIDTAHASITHAAVIIGGTALSLWAASFISSRMARRMVFGRSPAAEHTPRDSQKHAPLLASAVLPLMLVGLSGIGIFSLEQAVTMSTGAILLTLVLWSFAAARSMQASHLASIVLACLMLLLGLAIVALKAWVSH